MTTKAKALDKLIDAIAGEDVPMTSQTVAGRLEQLAAGIEDGTISVGGGDYVINLQAPTVSPSHSFAIENEMTELIEKAQDKNQRFVIRFDSGAPVYEFYDVVVAQVVSNNQYNTKLLFVTSGHSQGTSSIAGTGVYVVSLTVEYNKVSKETTVTYSSERADPA